MPRPWLLLVSLCAAVCLSAPGPVGAEEADLEGEAAPALSITSWLAAPEGETLAALRGFVVLVLPPGAVDLTNASAVNRWNDVRAGWWKKGLRVVAVVSEGIDEVPAGVEFSVAVGSADAYGGKGAVVGADGKVAWHGEAQAVPESVIAVRVRKAKPFHLEGSADAAKAFRKGKLGEARTLAGADSEIGKQVSARLAFWARQGARASACGAFGEATTCWKWIVKHGKGGDEVAAAETALAALKKDKAAGKEASAADAYARLRQDLAKADGKAKRIAALVKKAERVAKKTPRTRSIERAERLMQALRTDPAVAALKRFIAKQRIKTTGSGWRHALVKPPEVEFVDGKTYFWNLETNQGRIVVEFFPEDAPMHVSNAIYLTLLGFYDGLIFQRVIPGFMAQGGCPNGSGGGQIGYRFDGEFDGDATHDRTGILSAANSGPGTDSSHFFLTFKPTPHLDGKHTVYGVMVKGEDALRKMEKLGSESGATKSEIRIEKATITVE